MTLAQIKKNIEEAADNLREKINHSLKIIANSPEGMLTVRNKGKISYYFNHSKDGLKYLGNGKTDEIKQLEEKLYRNKYLRIAKQELESFEKCLKILDKTESSSAVFESIPENKRHLISEVEVDDTFVAKWKAMKYSPSDYTVSKCFKTKKGEYVRSKSELIIADKLFDSGIPYHYELPISLNHISVIRPDFAVLNVRTGKQLYWEHFGMMDNPEYCKSAIKKLNDYLTAGYVQGKDIVTTFESAQCPLNTDLVKTMIEQFCI